MLAYIFTWFYDYHRTVSPFYVWYYSPLRILHKIKKTFKNEVRSYNCHFYPIESYKRRTFIDPVQRTQAINVGESYNYMNAW